MLHLFFTAIASLGICASVCALEPIPAFSPGSRIVFQGDSITDGNRGRSPDPNHILGHSYVFLTAARHGAAFPNLNLNFYNRGVSGNTVRELERRWAADTLALKPDVLSVLIGVNDSSRNVPLEEYEKTYDELLAAARAAKPDLKLVLCAPFEKHSGRPVSVDIVARQRIVEKLALRYGAALVDFQKVFDAATTEKTPEDYWIWDRVHPTYRGHQLMADEWERVVRSFWK
jgi:lysophospholipase L1-like esterase